MKIQCRIQRPGGTDVELPNDDGSVTTIKFRPVDATRAESPHVADVDDNHAASLIGVAPDVYVPFEAAGVAKQIQRPNPNAGAEAAEATRIAAEAEAAAQAEADKSADSNENGVISIAELGRAIKAGTYSQEQLRELMAKEEEGDEPRKGFVALIVKALK